VLSRVTIFPIPSILSSYAGYDNLTAGPDGNLWFTETDSNQIGKMTLTGTVTLYTLPGSGYRGLAGITRGSDGNLWFSDFYGGGVGKITPTGVVTEYSCGAGIGIAQGPDGNIWVTSGGSGGGNTTGQLDRVTPNGVITSYNPWGNTNPDPEDITAGPQGDTHVWFTEYTANKIAEFDTRTAALTEFNIPTANSGPRGITVGPDGNLWFTEFIAGKVARITPQGTVTEFRINTPKGVASHPLGITSGPTGDGHLYVTPEELGEVIQVSLPPNPVFTVYQIPVNNPVPTAIIAGPDQNIWFDASNSAIGQLTLHKTLRAAAMAVGTEWVRANSISAFFTDSDTGTRTNEFAELLRDRNASFASLGNHEGNILGSEATAIHHGEIPGGVGSRRFHMDASGVDLLFRLGAIPEYSAVDLAGIDRFSA
jgi:streptogramin lyase